MTERMWTRRRYLTVRALGLGANFHTAAEAVSTTALAHPEWDMDEQRTWEQWEAAEWPSLTITAEGP